MFRSRYTPTRSSKGPVRRRLPRAVATCAALSASMLTVAACGSSTTPSSTSHNNSGVHNASAKQRIDFIFTGYTPPYFAPMAKAVTAAAARYPDLTVKVISANGSASAEVTDIDEAVAGGVKGIILNAVNESVTSAAQQAMKKGVPVITIDRDVSSPSARVAFIGASDVTIGREQTAYALSYLSKHHIAKPWHVVILQGTLGSSTAIDRLKGETTALKPYIANGSAKVILSQAANFATAPAQSLMSEELAKTTNIQLVIAANDAMALGAINAMSSQNIALGKTTFVAGTDAQPQDLTLIKDGKQLDDVAHAPYIEAFWAVEAMHDYLTHGTKPPAKFANGDVIIPMVLVTKSNVSDVGAWGTPKSTPPLPYGSGS